MTEAEWLECNNPKEMLEFLWDIASDRKLRLFAVACCQCSHQLLLNKDHRDALEISTRFADGQATEEELTNAHQRANDYACELYGCSKSRREIHRWAEATAVANATAVVTPIYKMAGYAADAVWMIHRAAHRNPNNRLAGLLRDIFGNYPFRFVAVKELFQKWASGVRTLEKSAFQGIVEIVPKPSWLTEQVLSVAQGFYAERAFDHLPVLGDALEEAGCTNEDILMHCRQPSEHVRGCWVVDLVLGKK